MERPLRLPVRSEAKKLFFGALLSGTGKTWVDDLQLLVDGKPIWELPKVERQTTVLERDHQFDSGSGILVTDEMSKTQIEHLAMLSKVWGFLKYHHPKVTAGQIPLGLRTAPHDAPHSLCERSRVRKCSRREMDRRIRSVGTVQALRRVERERSLLSTRRGMDC